MGALWSSCTRTVSPFLRTIFVYLMSGMGMLTLLAAAGWVFAFGAGFDWALRLMPAAISASSRPAIVMVDLLFKVPPFALCRAVLAGRKHAYSRLNQGRLRLKILP